MDLFVRQKTRSQIGIIMFEKKKRTKKNIDYVELQNAKVVYWYLDKDANCEADLMIAGFVKKITSITKAKVIRFAKRYKNRPFKNK